MRRLFIIILFFSPAACSAAWIHDFDPNRIEQCVMLPQTTPEEAVQVARDAEDWLKVTNFEASSVREEPGELFAAELDRQPGVEYLAVLSYPDSDIPDLHRRSYLYDAALAVLWFSWTGQEETAAGLAETLILLQLPNGSWGFSFSCEEDGYYNATYIRNGAIAWAAYALHYFGSSSHHSGALDASDQAVEYLQGCQTNGDTLMSGLFDGGKGAFGPGNEFVPYEKVNAAIAEHQFDIHMLLANSLHDDAASLAQRIFEVLWLPEEGRFSVSAGPELRNRARALDSSGAFGALWLRSIGRYEEAHESLTFTARSFLVDVDSLIGFRPYLDPVDGPLNNNDHTIIFVEGSIALGLAAHRLGNEQLALQTLHLARQLNCMAGPGLPYANRNAAGFISNPAAAPTLWYLFLEREMHGTETAPLFPGVVTVTGGTHEPA
jgi:hypothetical protein